MNDVQRRLAIVSDDLLAVDPRFSTAMQSFKRAFIKQAMIAHKGNQSKTADVLGIHRNTLSRQMEECELSVWECRSALKKPPARVITDYRLSLEREA